MINMRKCAVVPMMSVMTGKVEFELLIYGRTAKELMTVPNDVIDSLAREYPDHQSSIFMLRDLRPPRDGINFFTPPPAAKPYVKSERIAKGLPVRGIKDEDGSVRLLR